MSTENTNNEGTEDVKREEKKPEVITCPHCKREQTKEQVEELVTVRVRGSYRTEEWCPDCVDNDTFECHFTGERYFTDWFTERRTEDTGVRFCEEDSSGEVYYCSSDDEWYQYEENAPDQGPGDHIYEYHDGPRPWEGNRYTRAHLGLELEVELTDRSGLAEWMARRHSEFLCETDGSLSSVHGLEIIGPPLEPAPLALKWGEILAKLRGYHAMTPDNAGLHINADRASFGGPEILCNLFTLVHRYHRWFKRFTGRNSTYGQYEPGYRWGVGTPSIHGAVSASKRGRIEWRMFCSTTNDLDWKASVELVRAANLFVTQAPVDLFKEDKIKPMAIEWRKFLRREADNFPAVVSRAEKQGMHHKGRFLPVCPTPAAIVGLVNP